MTTSRTPEQDPLVPMRLALILLCLLFIGTLVGILTYFATLVVPSAILAGVIAAGAAALPLDKLIGR